jgi:hypothetical protein
MSRALHLDIFEQPEKRLFQQPVRAKLHGRIKKPELTTDQFRLLLSRAGRKITR